MRAVGNEWLAIEAVSACTGWIGALVLLLVGLLAVRPVSSRAGFLLAGAGGAKLLLNCCVLGPSLYQETAGGTPPEAYEITSGCGVVLGLAVWGLIAAAAAVLAKDVLARRGGPGVVQ